MLIENGIVVTSKECFEGYVYVEGEKIAKVGRGAAGDNLKNGCVINAQGGYIMAGVIDDQVHFREPGMTDKATIESEARAAVAGGVTSFMDMPNNKPAAVTLELLEAKYKRASEVSVTNYSFYMGATNDNTGEIAKLDPKRVCGVKVFMGSSTGNLLVDRLQALEDIFRQSPVLVATHCENEAIVSANLKAAFEKYGDNIPMELHPQIRSAQACVKSSSEAMELARKYNTRLHILHITTARECEMFTTEKLSVKRITGEVCVHHLWFCDKDYAKLGGKIKCNPAIKSEKDRDALRKALEEGRLDVVATDHAPHLASEKVAPYTKCPSGLPLVQHSLVTMLEIWEPKKVTKWMSENVADCFQIKSRGRIEEGYYADLVVVQKEKWTVNKNNIFYKCAWSPFEGVEFSHKVSHTIVNGNVAFENETVDDNVRGKRIEFDR